MERFEPLATVAGASRSAPTVYLALLSMAQERERTRFFVSYKTLRRLTGISDDRTIKGALNALNAAHWIKRERRARRGKDGKWIRHDRGFVLKFNRIKIRRQFNITAIIVGSSSHSIDAALNAKFVGSSGINEGSSTHRADCKDCSLTTPQQMWGSSTKKARGTDAAALTAKASSAASPTSAEKTVVNLSDGIPKKLREQITHWIQPEAEQVRVFNRLAFDGGSTYWDGQSVFVDAEFNAAKDRLVELAGVDEFEKRHAVLASEWMDGGDQTLVRMYALTLRLWQIIENDFEDAPEIVGEPPKTSESIGEIPTQAINGEGVQK